MEGQCLCGAVQVKVKDDNLFGAQRRGHLCHCKNCRKVAGGVLGVNLIIEQEKVEITGRENMSIYEDPETTSGTPISRFFCKTCGVPIQSVTPMYAGKTVLKLGIYPRLPVPEWESFASQRQEWEVPFTGCIQYKLKSFGEKM